MREVIIAEGISQEEIMKDSKGRFVKGVAPWNKGLKGTAYLSHLKEGKTWTTGKKGYTNSGSFKKDHKINLGKKQDDKWINNRVNVRKKNGSFNIGPMAIKRMTDKNYEDIYGPEKAKEIKQKIGLKSLGRIPSNKNKTYEEFFGKEKSKILREQIKLARRNQIFPMKDTKIELKIQQYLTDLKIEFYHHYYISEITHSYRCDMFIPIQNRISQKTIIECDGDWWHGNPEKYSNPNEWQKEQIEEDKIRTQELKEKGFRVIRLWENQINKIDLKHFKEVLN